MLDNYEKRIVAELIRNPRMSDNQVAKRTGIPVKTVNRKRKALEKRGIISYYLGVDNTETGTGDFTAKALYLIKFRNGIYRKQFLDAYLNMQPSEKDSKHLAFKYLGEQDGHLMLILGIESRRFSDLLEIYNVELASKIEKYLGHDSILETQVIPLTTTLSILHNYEPLLNMEQGYMKGSWPKEMLFVSDT